MLVAAVRAVLVGLGHRTASYASYSNHHPGELEIVGLVDPNQERLNIFAKKWDIPNERCFTSVNDLILQPALGEIAINGTMDGVHVETTIPLVESGYHVLLEKPIASSPDELFRLQEAVSQTGMKVVICHVLRYAPFYSAIKQKLLEGEIGEIMHIHSTENVSYHHAAVAFIRGKWNRREVNPIMLAKCCHDLDLLCWYKSGINPTKVSSMGGLHFFTLENAPENSGENCFDCEIERDCEYSARRHYIDNNLWSFYALAGEPNYERGDVTEESEAVTHISNNEYSRCVWKCDNDVADRQSVLIEFEDGSIATHDLVTNTAKATRKIQIVGTKGEISGDMTSGKFTIRKANSTNGSIYREEIVDSGVSGDLHGGGDLRLVKDFLSLIKEESPSPSTTILSDSINSHLIAYAADISMNESRFFMFDEF
ncbi:MAG: oxidoreductase [Euryarchaeota archaeon]|nr:oxidoreductase [Euryarchaeota archaeon]